MTKGHTNSLMVNGHLTHPFTIPWAQNHENYIMQYDRCKACKDHTAMAIPWAKDHF